MTANNNKQLIWDVLRQDRKAIGRVISMAENHQHQIFSILQELFPKMGNALRIGMTGFPGAGKSTIINQLAKQLTRNRKKVGIVLMDPSSPFSGGALLGDRIRMKEIQLNPRVYIRSMATRGKMGGLNLAARYASDILDAAGYDFVLLETVGVGQLEIDISTSSDVTAVVMTPESGDEVQAMKAGLMEVADIFIVNKTDRDKNLLYFSRIKKALEWHSEARGRAMPKIIPMSALYGKGVDAFAKTLIDYQIKKKKGKLNGGREKVRAQEDITSCLEEIFMDNFLAQEHVQEKITKFSKEVQTRKRSPYEAAEIILKSGLKKLNST